MGGNAIKNVQRLNKDAYEKISNEVPLLLLDALGERVIKIIKAYSKKENFGDMDLVVESDNLPNNYIEKLIYRFNLSDGDYVKNGNIFSFRYRGYDTNEKSIEFQIDLIMTKSDKLEIAYNYFNYNDLSNLLGRMTKKLGFKLGHDGLSYIERVNDHIVTNECFSNNYYLALEYLHLDVEQYKKGFETLEDIFKFVASSPFFNPDIYLLHNRNYISRTRDKKRKTYRAFLEYCEKYNDELNHFPYDNVDDYDGYGSSNNIRIEFTQKILEDHPILHYNVLNNRAEFILNSEFKKYFNGNIVGEHFNISGKMLGNVMKCIKNSSINTTEKKIETIKNKEYKFIYDIELNIIERIYDEN